MRISDINFRAAWMLKTLETNLLGMFQKEAFVDGISPIECTKTVWVGSRIFFRRVSGPCAQIVELLGRALLCPARYVGLVSNTVITVLNAYS
jgi:hypothetical protein